MNTEDKIVDNEFLSFVFLHFGLMVLLTVSVAVLMDQLLITAIISCVSLLIASYVFVKAKFRNKHPWIWGIVGFLFLPTMYFLIRLIVYIVSERGTMLA